MLTIYACGEAGSSALQNSGHAWITIKNISSKKLKFLSYSIKPRETISLSKWSESGYGKGGVYLNREQLVCDGTRPTSYSMKITAAQVKKIAKATPAESTYHTLWYNCTTYSTNMWNLVADRTHQISDGMFSIDIPGTVAKKIANWKGAKQALYKGDSKKHWTDVFFVEQTGKLKCVDAIYIDPVSLSLGVKSKRRLTASFIYSTELNKKIKWNSSNKKVATVKGGVVTGKSKGTTTITAKCGKLKAKCKVTVRKENGTYHTEKSSVRYLDDYQPFSLIISIVGNKLIIEGELMRIVNWKTNYSKKERVKGKRHIFALSPDTRFWNGDIPVSKAVFLEKAKEFMGSDTVGLLLDMENGKVADVGLV